MGRALSSLVLRGSILALTVVGACAVVHVVLTVAPGANASLPSFPDWLLGALGGDLGRSSTYRVGAAVTELLGPASVESLRVVGAAWVMSLVGAACLVVLWTRKTDPRVSSLSKGAVYVLSAAPAFVLAYWSIIGINVATAAAIQDGWLPRPAWFPLPLDSGSLRYVVAAGVLALGSGMLMETARALVAEVERVLRQEFVLFARAAGQPLLPHVLPSLVGPLTSQALIRLTSLFGGAVVVEVVFNVPGLGRLTWDAALARDTELLLGATAVWAAVFALLRMGADAVVTLTDPRARTPEEGA